MSTFSTAIYYGAVINPQDLVSYQALPRCLLAVSSAGNIDWIVEDVLESMVEEALAQKGCAGAQVTRLGSDKFIMPGFIDTHTHAPQYPNIGSGQQYELLEWLEKCTFPLEAKFADLEFARTAYLSVVRRVIDSGTTTCCYYGTLHAGATKVLADIVHSYGQRAFVGKCNMDRECPGYYIEASHDVSVEDTKDLIAHIRALPSASADGHSEHLVHPILTPRFAISCTSELMQQLGTLAASDPALAIQTHISENPSEINFTKELYKHCSTYAGVYDHYGLLRENTVLAHAVHLEPEEVNLIAQRKAGISHCPTSNFNISSGIARIGEYLDKGIKVGLGTDVSGGFSTSILTAIQHASIASKVLAMQNPSSNATDSSIFKNRQFSVATLLHLATLGGAQVCNLEQRIGSFAPGKSFDALVASAGLWGVGTESTAEERIRGMLERFMFCGDDRNIERVYVQGRFVGGTTLKK
ncbi:hypothetical protein PLICRDRAFT_54137 [Plicaturopsis crispa FD-325 SS-3]|nr:hypothetical protein PLICRDRAFT_54137 [Plicaturopsis crispa FD-325 SS-3]